MSGESDLEERFAALKRYYTAEVPAKIDEIAIAVKAAECASEAEAVAHAIMLAHRLAGTAGAYGLPGVGTAAGVVEDALREVAGAGWEPVRAALAELVGKPIR